MELQNTLQLKGRIGLNEVIDTIQAASVENFAPFQLELTDVIELDITGIQMIVAMKEKFGSEMIFKIDTIDPNLKSLLESSGVFELINDSSNS